jgi:RNA-directed DNA polymerase
VGPHNTPGLDWAEYSDKFRSAAAKANRDELYVEDCLKYSHRLFLNNVPIIFDLTHFSILVGYDQEYLLGAAYATSKFYRKFKIPKKSHGWRTIHEPLPSLKEIQRWILDNILYSTQISIYAKGFVPGLSIKENAKFHRHNKLVLSIDIKNFFPSIKRHRVYGFFRSLGYSQCVSNILGRICTLDDSLPQGAPSSPALTNILCLNLDRRLGGFALKNGYKYTRYADDITFSGELDAGRVIRFVEYIFRKDDFVVNKEKTRLMERHQRQEVTGVVVNNKLQAPRETRRKIRQEGHYIKKYGIESHLDMIGNTRAHYVEHLLGRANFVKFVNKRDRDSKEVISILNELAKLELREKNDEE